MRSDGSVRCAITAAVMALSMAVTGISLSSPALAATSEDNLRAAVASVRAASCGPLREDPLVDRVTTEVNKTDDRWLDQEGRASPTDDPLPVLKDLGFGGNKAIVLRGAATTDAGAIKGLVLQGYLDIPNCSYTSFGVSVLRNRTTNYYLAAVVLAA